MKQILGLFAENRQFRIALLKKEGRDLTIEALSSVPKEEIDKEISRLSSKRSSQVSFWGRVKQLYISRAPWISQNLFLATALEPHEALFRTLTLPMVQPRKAIAALPFQLETLLPFPLEEAIIAASYPQPAKEGPFPIFLFATKKQTLETHLKTYQALHIDPDYVTTPHLALYRFARWLLPQEKSLLLLHIGESRSCFVSGSSEQITLTQSLPGSLEGLLHYLRSKGIVPESTPWLLLGDSAASYTSWFEAQGISLHSLHHPSLSSDKLRTYALPIGIALEALAEDSLAVQWRQGALTASKCRDKRKRQLRFFIACCGIATLLFGLSSQMFLSHKQQILQHQISQCLPSSLHPSSSEEIEGSLYQWEQSLESKKLSYPFLPTTPLVSDLLAWLSTHPALISADGQKREGIEIKNIRYQLYKYPKLGEAAEPYAARVDLELTADTPRLAREFHDALLKGDLIVDEKKEIKWTTQHNTYWASFDVRPQKPREIP